MSIRLSCGCYPAKGSFCTRHTPDTTTIYDPPNQKVGQVMDNDYRNDLLEAIYKAANEFIETRGDEMICECMGENGEHKCVYCKLYDAVDELNQHDEVHGQTKETESEAGDGPKNT